MSGKYFEGFVFLLCGLNPNAEKKSKELIQRLGGQFLDRFVNNVVNCGIVGRVGSPGYQELLTNKIPMLNINWLSACHSKKTLVSMEESRYKVKAFQDLTIVCTQLNAAEKEKMRSLIQANGGKYEDKMEMGQCTHLVAKEPHGDKYTFALMWKNVHVITMSWIDDCVRKQGKSFQVLLFNFKNVFVSVLFLVLFL
jgi:hypothetical protein